MNCLLLLSIQCHVEQHMIISVHNYLLSIDRISNPSSWHIPYIYMRSSLSHWLFIIVYKIFMFMYRFVVDIMLLPLLKRPLCNNSKLKGHNLSGKEDIYLIREPLFALMKDLTHISPPKNIHDTSKTERMFVWKIHRKDESESERERKIEIEWWMTM